MAGILFPHRAGAPEIAGFRVQSSVFGSPIPIVYGTARIAGNLIDFIQGAVTASVNKPSKWATPTQTGWNYYGSLALALCEGPIVGIGNVWADKDKKDDFDTVIQPRDLWTLKLGTSSQTAIGYLSSPVTYQYTAYVAADDLSLPNNVLPNYSWEIQGLLIFGGGVVDALPSDVLEDVLTNANHGAAFPSGSLGSLSDYEDYCAAAGLFVSPALTSLRRTADVVDELMNATNSAVVWSDGLLKVIPYGDEMLSGHGHTYTPNTTPIYDLNDNDYLAEEGEDPVTVRRKNPTECFNQVFVEFENRANDYNADVREAKNDADILINGLRPAPKISLPLIKDADVARLVAQFRQQREQFVVNEYSFRVGWKFSLLEPMDLITLTDSGLGLDFTPVRITETVELEDASGIQITAEDWPFGTASATRYPSEENDGHKPANNVDPGDTTSPIVFTGPLWLTNDTLEIWFAPSGGQYWGGCEIWVSTDGGSTYRKLGSTNEKATYGVLDDALLTGDAYPLVDLANTAKVTPFTGSANPSTVSLDDLNALVTLCYCDGEFLAYRDAALVSGNYELSYLYRGLYGSTIQASVAVGNVLVYCETGIVKIPFPQGVAGQTLKFKFPSFNIYGNALQSLAVCTPVSFVIGSTPSGGSITSISTGGTISPCDGVTGSTNVSWVDSGLPVGVTYSVQIQISSGAYNGETRTYDGVTSGDTLGAPFCPGESFDVTVQAIKDGITIATRAQTFTS